MIKKTIKYTPPYVEFCNFLTEEDIVTTASGSQLEDVEGGDIVDEDNGWEIL